MWSYRPVYILAAMAACTFASCSFNYGNVDGKDDLVPEMVLETVTANRYEDAALSVVFSANTLEMYRSDRLWAADSVSFIQYASGDSQEIEARGGAGLLLVNDADEIYTLGAGVTFEFLSDNLFVSANDLRWSKKERTLSGTRSGEVVISKDDGTLVRGIGFFADTASRTYEFSENVSGVLVSDATAGENAETVEAADESAPASESPLIDANTPAGLE